MRGTSRDGRQWRSRRLVGAITSIAALLAFTILPAQATLDTTLFELDKDAKNDTTTVFWGVLNAAVNSSTTSIQVCQTTNTDVPPTYTILVDAERMTVTASAGASGGGCPAKAPNKKNYTVTRAADSTTAGAHSKGENVSRINAVPSAADEWDDVFAQADWLGEDENVPDDSTCGAIGAVECTFVHDGRAASIFTSSKDYDEITDWQWRDQSVPDADELDDGFAIKYSNGSQNVFFGADRFATNGAKDAGFWFFHQSVTPVEPVGMADGTFMGEHTEPDDGGDGFCGDPQQTTPNCSPYDLTDTGGDILILTTFSDGGATVTVRVFEWIGPAGTTAALLLRSADSDCLPGPVSESCATVNNTTVETDWPYDGKSEPADNEVNTGGFLEGGINLTDLGLEGCFSSFMATTRSAPSLTADPKDWILGDFEACDTDLTTTPADSGGTALTDGPDDGNVPDIQIGTGAAGVDVTDNAVLDVKGTQTWAGTLDFYLCGPIESGTCDKNELPTNPEGVLISSQGIDQDTSSEDPPTFTSGRAHLTEVGRYCWRGEFTSSTEGVPDAIDESSGECFEVTPVQPTLTTTAVEETVGLSPTVYDGLADVNGSGAGDSADDSAAFYGDTSIIDGALDCDGWGSTNDGTAGDGTIDSGDACTLVGHDGTTDGLTINVVDGQFATSDPDGAGVEPAVAIADGTSLPTVFNAGVPGNADVGDSDFAWSTITGRVDSNGDEAIDGDDCHVGIIGGANILGADDDPVLGSGCGFGPSVPSSLNGYIDLNGDLTITQAGDSCDTGCFFGHDVFNGLVHAGTVDFGGELFDAATLLGTANQPGDDGPGDANGDFMSINATNQGDFPANDDITFTLVGPDGESTACDSVADLAEGTGTNPEDVGVSGDGHYDTSGFEPDAPGDYHWKASYGPDSPNTLGVSHNDSCDEDGEDVTVQQIPTEISTDQKVFPQDSATITSSVTGDDLPTGGTVVFRLYDNATCEDDDAEPGTPDTTGFLYEETVNDIGGSHSVTVGTDNTTVSVDDDATVYWRVTYDPGDSAHTGRQSDCVESTTVSFTDDAGPGTLFP